MHLDQDEVRGRWAALVGKGRCQAPDCDRPAHCRGLCTRHYRRWYVKGFHPSFDPRA